MALSKYARLRAARFQAGQYRNMSANRGRTRNGGLAIARRDQPNSDISSDLPLQPPSAEWSNIALQKYAGLTTDLW